MRHSLAVLALVFSIVSPVAAQHIEVRPWLVPASDTADHVDISWKSVPAHATAAVVATAWDKTGTIAAKQTEKVSWRSSDTTVAIVSGTTGIGLVAARGFGAATINATATGGLTASIVVCSYGAAYPYGVTAIGPAMVPMDSTVQYRAASPVTGETYAAPCVHWSTSDALRATIDRRGVVTGHLLGPVVPGVTAFLGVP